MAPEKLLVSPEHEFSRHVRQRLWFGPAIVFVVALIVYGSTAPPGLTWAHHSADGGDLITAAVVGGVPHPSGYPTFVLLARLFSRLPWHTPAWRVTLLSMISGAAAAALTAASVQRLVVRSGDPGEARQTAASSTVGEDMQAPAVFRLPLGVFLLCITVPAVFAGLAVAFAPMFWGQATVAEVYALHAFLAALVIWSTSCWRTTGQVKWIVLAGLALGWALGNHLTSIWLAPFVGISMIAPPATVSQRGRAWAGFLLAVALGLVVYMYLPLAASANPPVNWGNPQSFEGFWWVVSGQVYRPFVFAVDGLEAFGRLASWSKLLWREFLPWCVVLALGGLAWLARVDRPMVWAMLISLALSLIWAISYNTTDSVLTLLPAWVMIGLWIGLGVGWLVRSLWRLDRRTGVAVAVIGLVLLSIPLAINWRHQDLSADQTAEAYLAGLEQVVGPEALVVTVGDQATFALWYARYGLQRRADIVPISRDLWPYQSYRQTLESTHGSLQISQTVPDLETVLIAALERQRPVYVTQVGQTATGLGAPSLPLVAPYHLQPVQLPPATQAPAWALWKLERAP
jgi:hypothetical protein